MKAKEPIRIAQVMGKMTGGGVEAVVMNYYRHIDRKKIQFDFIIDEDSTNIPTTEIENLGGRVIIVPPYQKLFKYMKALEKVFRDNEYRIVHSHINTLSIFPLRAAKRACVPVRIAHSHSTFGKGEWKRNALKRILRLFSKAYATQYFVCSDYEGRWLFGNSEVFVVKNAIDTKKFKFDAETRHEVRQEFNIDGKLVIGHVGRFMTRKNTHSLLMCSRNVQKNRIWFYKDKHTGFKVPLICATAARRNGCSYE